MHKISNNPKVSIIITTYRRPKLLKRAIESVLRQNFQDWELIVVDDCSQDNTKDIVDLFSTQDSRIRYICLETNFGRHTKPKNIGTQHARAPLIAYLDDDNTWRMNHLQILFDTMQQTNADIVYGDRMVIDKDGKPRGRGICIEDFRIKSESNPQDIERNFFLPALLQKNFIDTSDVLIKKSCLEEIGGWDDNCLRFADWNLWVRLGKLHKKFIRVPEIITDYYLYEDSQQLRFKNFTFDRLSCPVYINGTQPRKVAVFTLTKDRLDYTKRMFASIRRFTKIKFDHFVVDNGSKDGTPEYLKDLKKKGLIKEFILNKDNKGISKASNQALDIIGDSYDYIAKVDNDAEFITPNWLENALDFLRIMPCCLVGFYVEGLVNNPGGGPRIGYAIIGEHLVGPALHVGGIANIAPARLYRGFRWNPNDLLHGEQDIVFSKYAQYQGYELFYLEEDKVYHIDTTVGQQKTYPDYFKEREKEKITHYKEKE